jgi:hypothetical protein
MTLNDILHVIVQSGETLPFDLMDKILIVVGDDCA